VGKTTAITSVTAQMNGIFRSHTLYHWRPELLWRSGQKDSTKPHAEPPRGPVWSAFHLAAQAADFVLGYSFRVFPWRVRSGLIVFDRYYHDLLADAVRYRYGGSRWWASFLERFVPKPDLFLLLDADEDGILSRKQELSAPELRRAIHAYRELSGNLRDVRVIDARGGRREVAELAVRSVALLLSHRFTVRNWSWLAAPARIDGDSGLNRFGCMPSHMHGTANGSDRFVILPTSRNPRWLVPLNEPGVRRMAMDIYLAYSHRARLYKAAMQYALTMPAALWARIVSVTHRDLSAFRELVAHITGERNVRFAISLGSFGKYRKLCIQVMRPDTAVLGYIKVPLTDAAIGRVRNEASTLARLARHPAIRPHIPEVMFAGEWERCYVLFQTALRGGTASRRLGRVHHEFLRTLWQVEPVERPGAAVISELRDQMQDAVTAFGYKLRDLIDKAVDQAARELENTPIPCGVMHGDFAPWNTRVSGSQLLVFDWESAAWSAPVWWDVFNFNTQVRALLHADAGAERFANEHPAYSGALLLYLTFSLCSLADELPHGFEGIRFRVDQLEQCMSKRPQKSSRISRILARG
jgi:hypothetical protein